MSSISSSQLWAPCKVGLYFLIVYFDHLVQSQVLGKCLLNAWMKLVL